MIKRFCFFLFFLLLISNVCFALFPNRPDRPDRIHGNLIFLGVNHDSTQSVWLSLTDAAGSFELEGPRRQLIDEWTKSQRGVRLSLSPIVARRIGGRHHLINAENGRQLDAENQRGGIVFPPFTSEGIPAHPIIYPGTPAHPIIYPGTPAHPIIYPGTPAHPIIYPGTPAHPIIYPGTPEHPIVIPPTPGSTPDSTPGSTTGAREALSNANWPESLNVDLNTSLASQTAATEGFEQSAPITEARQIDEGKAWDIWTDNYYYGIRDGRNDVNTNGKMTDFSVGADKHITNNLVAGLKLTSIASDMTAFNNNLENDLHGFRVGPYAGYQLSNKWAVDGALEYGQYKNNNEILSLNSYYTTSLLSATLHATGLYQYGSVQFRPEPLISYTYFRNPSYNFNGTILGAPVQVTQPSQGFALGYAEFKFENNYTQVNKKGDIFQPYYELGIDYAFARPSANQVGSNNLALGNVPEVAGLATLGLRMIHAKKLVIETSASYLSVGESSYDVWNARLLVSYMFV